MRFPTRCAIIWTSKIDLKLADLVIQTNFSSFDIANIMSLNFEAIIGLLTLLVAFPPTAWVLYEIVLKSRRHFGYNRGQ